MKSRTSLLVLAGVVGFGMGFWLYGIGRTMRQNVDFNTTAFLAGLLLGVAIPLLVLLPLLIAKKLWQREEVSPVSPLVIGFAVCLLIGSLASESWILRDEARFAAESSKTNDGNPHSRPRAWPNQTCSLVYVPGKGIHSTD